MRSATNRQYLHESGRDAWREIQSGLAQQPKRLPSKLFYDARGSLLFERITELPEYYLARVERQILRDRQREIAACLGADRVLIELGSGASRKTRLLLDALPRPIAYVPIDISPSALQSSVTALRTEYPRLVVRPVIADYTRPLRLPLAAEGVPLSVFFPGSTIGNLEPLEATAFLARLGDVRGWANPYTTSVTETNPRSGNYNFAATVDLTKDAVTPRGRGEVQPP